MIAKYSRLRIDIILDKPNELGLVLIFLSLQLSLLIDRVLNLLFRCVLLANFVVQDAN